MANRPFSPTYSCTSPGKCFTCNRSNLLQLMKAKSGGTAGLCNHPLISFYVTQLEFHKLRKSSPLK